MPSVDVLTGWVPPPTLPEMDAKTIAIDGPAGSGKSTVSRRVAAALGFTLVDTGALYRCVALCAQQEGAAWDDEAALAALFAELNIRFEPAAPQQRVFLQGEEVTSAIRTPEISRGASAVSAVGAVRAGLLELQRTLALQPPGAVLEGRDIGTVVLPEADVKVFLTANPEVRARRRFDELVRRGVSTTFEEVLANEQARDHADSNRAIAPLKCAEDAHRVDSTTMDVDQVVETILGIASQQFSAKP